MRVTPTGQSEYHEGNEVGRYGLDLRAHKTVFIHYHDGLRCVSEPAWAMDSGVEWKISVSVETILVADSDDGLYAIDRDAFRDSTITIDGRQQYLARAGDAFVAHLGDPSDHLRGHLWITPENAHGGYHKDKNEA